MDNLDKLKIEELTGRVECLEKKIQLLSRWLTQIGENLAVDKYALSTNTEEKKADSISEKVNTFEGRLIENVVSEDHANAENIVSLSYEGNTEMPLIYDDSQVSVDSFRLFNKKYDSGSNDFELCLDVARESIQDLTYYVDWSQVPDEIQNNLYLEDAYESIMYYADSVNSKNKDLYLVAPVEPIEKYTQSDVIRLALPYFYNITNSVDLNGKLFKLIKPAVFEQEDNGRYVLVTKGDIAFKR